MEGSVAQLVEQATFNREVPGSSPGGPTIGLIGIRPRDLDAPLTASLRRVATFRASFPVSFTCPAPRGLACLRPIAALRRTAMTDAV